MISLLGSLLVREMRLEHFPTMETSQQQGVREFQNCLIMPDAVGLHDMLGTPIPGTFLERGFVGNVDYPYGYPTPIDVQSAKQSAEEVPRVVFLPYSDLAPFGHLLTEGAGWFWPFFDDHFRNHLLGEHRSSPNEYPLIVLVDRPKGRIPIETISSLLGVPRSYVRLASELKHPIYCQQVNVPIPSMVNRRYLLPHHFQAVQRLLDRVYEGSPTQSIQTNETTRNPNLINRVYLSRSKLPKNYRLLHGEQELEIRLRDFGWDVVYPEQLSIAEQVSHLASARTIAGEAGSAFHLLMALGNHFAVKRVAMLGVRRVKRDPRILNYIAQFRNQPIDFRYLACMGFSPRKPNTNDAEDSFQIDRYLFASPKRTAQWLNQIANEPIPFHSRGRAQLLR